MIEPVFAPDFFLKPAFFDKICGDSSMDQIEDKSHNLRVFGKQEAKRERET